MLKLETYTSGKVVNGTFSKKVNGVALPTKEAIYLISEAFEMDELTDPYADFSDETREFIAEKYDVSPKLMILSTRALGIRINNEDKVIKLARDLAFAYYQATKKQEK